VDDEEQSVLPPLPEPGSPELAALVSDSAAREIYGLLYRRRDNPPTMREVEMYMADKTGKSDTHTNRRLRALRESGIDVPAVHLNGDYRYPLKGWRETGPRTGRPNISDKVEAQVLAPQRCAQCGKTPLEDGVKLVVDHKVPRQWGGGDEIENLQPLCERCNGGKQAWYATYDTHADQIREAILHDEVHRRIGELLKALEGEWVYTELIGIVASAQAYQEDYQKRLRELRTLDWVIPHVKRHHEGARVRTYYKCVSWEPWPDGPIITEIRRREKANKAAKEAAKKAAEE
jgi:5-methylcytosine-specific restriction endonuclease McrA